MSRGPLYSVGEGAVQAVLHGRFPWCMHHFGGAQYARDIPVITPGRQVRINAILVLMNSNILSRDEGIAALEAHTYW